MSRRWAVVTLVLSGLILAAGMLGPSPAALFSRVAIGADHVEGLESITFGAVELAANVLVFVPVALLLAAALPRVSRWWIWAGCVGASCVVELVQVLLPDRHPTIVDVLTNSAGAGVGVLLHAVLAHRRRARRPG